MSQADEVAVLNESNFFVCQRCGYTVLNEREFKKRKWEKHKTPSGYVCKNDGINKLKKFSLDYRFKTDVVQLKFLIPDLSNWEIALSVLHGVIKGIYSYLNIEQNDISGCLHYFFNAGTHRQNYELVLYDKTPFGAGHVRHINNEKALEGALVEILRLME